VTPGRVGAAVADDEEDGLWGLGLREKNNKKKISCSAFYWHSKNRLD